MSEAATPILPFSQMFEMDAYVGVDVLGLIFMKGEQPHAGFPEVQWHGKSTDLMQNYRSDDKRRIPLIEHVFL